MNDGLESLLRPAAIAVIGATEDIRTYAGAPLHNLVGHGFRGAIYPVNPRRAVVQGIPAYPTVLDVPGPIDTAVIAVPSDAVLGVLAQVVQAGARSATIVSSGFGEEAAGPRGKVRHAELDALIRASGIRVLGPNTTGLVNLADGYVPRAAHNQLDPADVRAGGAALITQSGACGNVVFNRAQAHGVGIVAGLLGKLTSSRIPDGVQVLPNQVALATQLQHAVGLAWGLQLQRKPGVVLAFCGEGAASEGDFHEACNLAGVRRAPIVFVVMNNQWAISTSRQVQSAGEFYRRAEGYGFPGVAVDGNDLLAVYEITADAVERARRGEGPSLIDCLTYRLSFHNTTDNPRAYLPEGWLEEAEREDPIPRLQRYLAAQGLWDDATQAAMEGEVAEHVDGAVEAAMAMPSARPGDVFENVYSDAPARVRRQREELSRLTGGNA